jgi:excisionase family DNA binding protein
MTALDVRLLIPVKEASAWLGIPAFTLYSWALSRRIPHYKIGKRVMFSRDDLKRWIDAQHRKEAS